VRRPVLAGFVALPVLAAVELGAATPAYTVELPGAGLITDALGGAAGWSFGQMASGVPGWVLSGVAWFANGVVNFLKTSARPQVEAAWFAGPGSPFATVRNLAGMLLVGFVFLGLIQGLLRGDPGAMVRRVGSDLPLAIIGMVATVAVVARLLDLTDALSTAVLNQSDGQALRFLTGFGSAGAGASGFAVVVVGLLAIAAGLLLWVELMVRSALVYLLVAVSPLVFAATVWPAARGVLRRTAHLLLAVILSKFVIAVALAVGVAALGAHSGGDGTAVGAAVASGPIAAGAGPGPGPEGDPAAGLGALLVGAVILALASFAPFIVLRLIPIAEAAVVATGVSRGPMRAAQSGLGTYYYANSLTRLGGSSAALPTAGPPGAPAKPGGAPTPAGSAAGGAGETAGGSAGAAAASAGVARAAGRRATSTARQAGDAASASHLPAPPESPLRLEPTTRPPDGTRRTT
jgi:hypothetical protein